VADLLSALYDDEVKMLERVTANPGFPARYVPIMNAMVAAPEEEAARATLAEIEKFAKRVSLLDLTERTCKWPIGDPTDEDFAFCGLACVPGKPYCENHVAVAFQPMSSRRDRARASNR
jgi:hypothetical protein